MDLRVWVELAKFRQALVVHRTTHDQASRVLVADQLIKVGGVGISSTEVAPLGDNSVQRVANDVNQLQLW